MCFKTYTVIQGYVYWTTKSVVSYYALLFNLRCHDCLQQYISAFKCHVNLTRYFMDADGHANNSMVGEGETELGTEQETYKPRQIEELIPKEVLPL